MASTDSKLTTCEVMIWNIKTIEKTKTIYRQKQTRKTNERTNEQTNKQTNKQQQNLTRHEVFVHYYLESFQVSFPLVGWPVAMETDTRVLIHHGFGPSPLRNEVLLGVVTVQLGPAEDDGLVHLMFIDGPHQVFNLQDLHRLWESFWKQKQFSHFHTFSILTFSCLQLDEN